MKTTIEKEISIEEELLHCYSPNQLKDIFEHYFRQYLADNPSLFKDWNLNPKEFTGLTVRIREIVRLIAIVFCDEKQFYRWNQRLPYMASKVLETIIWENKQDLETLEQRTKGDLRFKVVKGRFNQDTLNPDYCLFQLSKIPRERQKGKVFYYFNLPFSIRRKLKSFLPRPRGYELRGLKAPKRTDFEFTDQQNILHLFPLILDYIQEGNLEVTKSGAPKRSAMTRLSKYAEMMEFFPEDSEGQLKTTRMERLAQLCLLYRPGSSQKEPKQHLKSLVSLIEDQGVNLLRTQLTHLKGWHQVPERFNPLKDTVQLLKELPENGWISINQLQRFALLHDLKLNPIDESDAAEFLYLPLNWQGWGHTKREITPDLFDKTLKEPWLKSTLGLFASLGILDIKYHTPLNDLGIDEYQHPYLTPFDGLQYVRLTELGAYALSLSDHFQEVTTRKNSVQITLDEDRLILSLSRFDAVIAMKLDTIANRIGSRLFKVDHNSFLLGCSDQIEVQNRILMLRDLVAAPFPPLWEQFFQKMIEKLNLISSVTDAVILKLDPTAEELVESITSDQEIRPYVQLDENFHLIVKTDDLDLLREKLRKYGYLF